MPPQPHAYTFLSDIVEKAVMCLLELTARLSERVQARAATSCTAVKVKQLEDTDRLNAT